MPAKFIVDVYTDKARYHPGGAVKITVALSNESGQDLRDVFVRLSFWSLNEKIGAETSRGLDLVHKAQTEVTLTWFPPGDDFRGYLVDVTLTDARGKELDRAVTAVDVSSDWRRFPRYGYLAHFDREIDTEAWVAALNRYHLNGLQFYDFQYKHHWPLAGTVQAPLEEWRDIAGRPTYQETVLDFINAAHKYNMMAMAYNASYGAYADAFHDGSGVKVEWAAWRDASMPRTEKTVKSFGPFPSDWSTPYLLFMNQNDRAWQDYLFHKMADLFAVYPFDGWHIDTYGDKGAYAYDGSYIDYTAGFRPFTDRAHDVLGKRVLFNTVSGRGQAEMARSKADFVYTELWEESHPTYESILACADELHTIDPNLGIVFPAYLHRQLASRLGTAERRSFNAASVLLLDAVIFAAGAHHLELGDGGRMLSHEYFVNDEKILVPPELRQVLRRYYDFLVAYQNYLRDQVEPATYRLELAGTPISISGDPGHVWVIGRAKAGYAMLHLINLLGARGTAWRDDEADYPEAPTKRNLRLKLRSEESVKMLGWASPDVDGGRFHALKFATGRDGRGAYVEFTLPSLQYWDMIIIRHQ